MFVIDGDVLNCYYCLRTIANGDVRFVKYVLMCQFAVSDSHPY